MKTISTEKLKPMYIFEILVPGEAEESSTTTNEQGQEVTQIVKVKKDIPRRVALKKPSRKLVDEAELYYMIMVGQGLEKGLISRAILAKKIANEGGVMSEKEKESFAEAYWRLQKLELEFQKLSQRQESEMSESEKQRKDAVAKEMIVVRRALQEYESEQMSIYNITAEYHARNKTAMWWMLHLTYMETKEADVWVPMFPGDDGDIKTKTSVYEAIEDGEGIPEIDRDFYFRAIRRAAASVAFWFYGHASEQSDFAALEDQIKQEAENK